MNFEKVKKRTGFDFVFSKLIVLLELDEINDITTNNYKKIVSIFFLAC